MDSIGVIPGPFTTADVLAVLWLFLAWLGSGWLVEHPPLYTAGTSADHAVYAMSIADVQAVVSGAIGGSNIGETVEGLARFPINLRYPKEWRDSPQALRRMPILTQAGQQITLGTVANVSIAEGPPMLKTENARPSTWVYVDVRGRDLASVVGDLQRAVAKQVRH